MSNQVVSEPLLDGASLMSVIMGWSGTKAGDFVMLLDFVAPAPSSRVSEIWERWAGYRGG